MSDREQANVEALEEQCEPLWSSKPGTPEHNRLVLIGLLLNFYDPEKYKFDGPRLGDTLTRQIEHAGYSATGFTLLRAEEMIEVDVNAPDKSELFIGAAIDDGDRSLIFIRANHELLVAPISFFRPKTNGERPNFSRLAIMDYGRTLQLGKGYECTTEDILYEFDPDYKRIVDARTDTLKTDMEAFKAKRKTAQTMQANLRAEIKRLEENFTLAQQYVEALEEDMGRNDVSPSQATVILHEKFDDIRRTE